MTNVQICERLDGILAKHDAKCLFAVEAGSRAWGFESANSDYDVRFVYWKPRDWYLGIETHRDVIEELGDDDLDFAGWDLRKALKLAHKSNPSLHDWLATNESYYEDIRLYPEFKQLCLDFFDPNACFHHFRSMATINFRDFRDSETLPYKKYFYVTRALLCARYIADHRQPAPCRFGDLLSEFYPSGSVRDELERLLVVKRSGAEVAKMKRSPILHAEIERLFLATSVEPEKRPVMSTAQLNEFFRKVVAGT
jgi:predicted nucleotidyltransferase